MNPATQLPLPLKCRFEIEAHDPVSLRAGLHAAAKALEDGVEPNVLWAPGYRIAITTGSRP